MARRVVLLFGPPGAGKSTRAHTFGLRVYDRDDPEWNDSESRFREALRQLGRNPRARAVVIRTGSTAKARADAEAMCRATEVHVLTTPRDECIRRIQARGRGDIAAQIAAVDKWWRNQQLEPVQRRRREL